MKVYNNKGAREMAWWIRVLALQAWGSDYKSPAHT